MESNIEDQRKKRKKEIKKRDEERGKRRKKREGRDRGEKKKKKVSCLHLRHNLEVIDRTYNQRNEWENTGK